MLSGMAGWRHQPWPTNCDGVCASGSNWPARLYLVSEYLFENQLVKALGIGFAEEKKVFKSQNM